MKKMMIIASLLYLTIGFAEENKQKGDENVIYKYRKHEKFDFGSLEIKGSIVAPGDLSVKERSRRTFSRNLYDRDNFNKEVIEDIRNLR